MHVGCGDGKLTAALHANDSFLVHGLDADAANIERARKHLRSLGLYGKVSVRRYESERLPYAENVVNLLVSEDLGKVTMEEVLRVLAPDGVAYVKTGGNWAKTVKPRPAEIDEWTHFLHDASNNAVAKDTRVGPPRRLQWSARPSWCRSHEFISSLAAMVSGGGRLFYVFDEGVPGVTDRLPERWTLTGRDAFNGVLLWKRPLPDWRRDEWRGTSMRGRPPSVPRRLVVAGDRLYATLSHAAPVSVIDAATGETLHEIEGTDFAQEILVCGDTLVLRLAKFDHEERKVKGAIAAVDLGAGKIKWRAPAGGFMPQSLTAAEDAVIFNDGKETVCLNATDGKQRWKTSSPRPQTKRGRDRTFIIHGNLVLEGDNGRIAARDLKTGKMAWQTKTGGGSMRGHDLFVAQGCVWHAASGRIVGYDLSTGKAAKTIDPKKAQSRGHHLRCYRAKATEQYFITQFRGAEFISLTGEDHCPHDWIRGACRYGVMPANGMLYAPPHQCFCYSGVMTRGLNAFTTTSDGQWQAMAKDVAANRLERGPAYEGVRSQESGVKKDDWPMYRHDAARSGGCRTTVGIKVKPAWRIKLDGRLTPPVIADGRVHIAVKDRHAIYALNAEDGSRKWLFTADGPVDSPPTILGGRVLFGSADGWVYCLRASDGQLAWRFRAAPVERLIAAESQLESAWRVHGSVVPHEGLVYCTAGRSTFLDGGIHVYGLDPASGKVRHHTRLDTLKSGLGNSVTDQPHLPAFYVDGTRSDLLVSDGRHLYLGQIELDSKLVRQPTPYLDLEGAKTEGMDIAGKPYVHPELFSKGYDSYAGTEIRRGPMGNRKIGRHLFTTGGFLDDSWWHRSFWMHGNIWPGFQIANLAPKAGQILVFDESTTYAVQAYPKRWKLSPKFVPQEKGYLLVADDNDNDAILDYRAANRDKGMGFTRAKPPKWHQWVPLRMRALVATENALFAAGPPDVLDEKDPMAAFEGRKGAQLWTISKSDGGKLAQIKLPAEPIFDGMAAAGGRLFVSLKDGSVLCLSGQTR